MLKSDDLKRWINKDFSRVDKILLCIATFDRPVSVSEIRDAAVKAGLRIIEKWNVSDILRRHPKVVIRLETGWELSDDGVIRLRELGLGHLSPSALQVAVDLRNHLEAISDAQTRAFVSDAISCHEYGLYRPAIVMAWLGAMDVLHRFVFQHKLLEFNAEAAKVFGNKWKQAKSQDDLGKMGERDFLDRLEGISVLGKNAKAQLVAALDLRNGCGHPNSLQVSANKSAAHIETLLQNVFQKFQPPPLTPNPNPPKGAHPSGGLPRKAS